jgi:hypothetical protein
LASNAELAQARAEATSAEALVVHLRLMIEKLKRDLSLGRGSRDDGTSHLLVLQQLDVQISFGRPRRAGDVAQPCGGEVERGLTVRERTHDTRAPPDLAQDALERVVGGKRCCYPT